MPGRSTQARPTVKTERPPTANGHISVSVNGDADLSDEDVTPPDSGRGSSFTPNSSFNSVQALGSDTRRLMATVTKLEQLGIEASGMPLPKIVAVGDQSAGKSSLIEAISEIRVPRAANTCTRCVIQISIVEQLEESWKITLHKKYMFEPDNTHAHSFPNGQDYGPWRLMSRPEDGPSITLKSSTEIERALARAQDAILRPREDGGPILRDPRTILRTKPEEFSPNVIRLDITGPRLPTLSLYDLPGVITQSRSDDGEDLPGLIRGLATEYIDNPNTIVMLATPVTNDLDNSNAYELVNRLGALGKTLAVITKADKLDSTDNSQWLQLIDGTCATKYKAGHGVIVTKQPGAGETQISHDKARERESHFFASDRRWADSELSRFQNRFGTKKLRETLTDLLRQEIMTGLPLIERKISQETARLEARLLDFPRPEQNSLATVLGLLAKVDIAVTALVRGDADKKDLLQKWRETASTFSKALKGMKPVLAVGTGPEPQWREDASAENPIVLDDDDEVVTEQATPSSATKRSKGPPNTPNKQQRSTPSSVAPRNGTSTQKLPKSLFDYPPISDGEGPEYARKWSLEDIRRIVKNESTSGIQRPRDPYAVDRLIKDSMDHWSVPLRELFDVVKEFTLQYVLSAVRACAHRWESTEFFRLAQHAVRGLVESLSEDCYKRAELILRAKVHKPFTLTMDVLQRYTEEELAAISRSRHLSRTRAYVKWDDTNKNRETDANDLARRAGQVKETKLGPDPYAGEVQTMADVRGYYNLAVGNVVDSICELIQLEVFEKCALDVRDYLGHALGLDRHDCTPIANRLLSEDPERLMQRQELEEEKSKMENAQRILKDAV